MASSAVRLSHCLNMPFSSRCWVNLTPPIVGKNIFVDAPSEFVAFCSMYPSSHRSEQPQHFFKLYNFSCVNGTLLSFLGFLVYPKKEYSQVDFGEELGYHMCYETRSGIGST